MQQTVIRHQLDSIVGTLTDDNVKTVIDFAEFLKAREENHEFFEMQTSSKAYQEWLSSDNEIYDEVFQDELPKR